MNVRSICKRDIHGGDGVQGQAPRSRGVAIAAMSRVAADAYTWTGAVGKRSFGVFGIVNPECQIAQSNATADLGNVICIETDRLEILEINDHATTLAARGE